MMNTFPDITLDSLSAQYLRQPHLTVNTDVCLDFNIPLPSIIPTEPIQPGPENYQNKVESVNAYEEALNPRNAHIPIPPRSNLKTLR